MWERCKKKASKVGDLEREHFDFNIFVLLQKHTMERTLNLICPTGLCAQESNLSHTQKDPKKKDVAAHDLDATFGLLCCQRVLCIM